MFPVNRTVRVLLDKLIDFRSKSTAVLRRKLLRVRAAGCVPRNLRELGRKINKYRNRTSGFRTPLKIDFLSYFVLEERPSVLRKLGGIVSEGRAKNTDNWKNRQSNLAYSGNGYFAPAVKFVNGSRFVITGIKIDGSIRAARRGKSVSAPVEFSNRAIAEDARRSSGDLLPIRLLRPGCNFSPDVHSITYRCRSAAESLRKGGAEMRCIMDEAP